MFGNIELAITKENNRPFTYNRLKLKKEIDSLQKLLEENPSLRQLSIDRINQSTELFVERDRINSLHEVREYMKQDFLLNKETIIELHQLIEHETSFRTKEVYITDLSFHRIPSHIDKGISPYLIEKKIEEWIQYIKGTTNPEEINVFIKSQIISFYFTYIHPFNDGNGRCARSISNWYLNNNHSSYFTLINRGILSSRDDYNNSIQNSKKGDLTPYLEYCLKTLREELLIEKEIQEIEQNTPLTEQEYHTLINFYHLEEKTIESYSTQILPFQGYKKKEEILQNELFPLIEKGIIEIQNDQIEIKKSMEKQEFIK